MNRRILYFLLILFAFKVNAQVITVNVNPSSQTKGLLMLSELVEQIEYISLETNDNCIVGHITDFDISDNYIVVYVFQSKEIFLFSRNGRFITMIGSQGQGPAEYLSPGWISIDEKKKYVYVQDGQNLLIYDFTGKFVTSFSFEGRNKIIYAYHDNQFITGTLSVQSNEDYYVYGIWDSTMKLLKQDVKGVPVKNNGGYNAGAHVSPPISSYFYQEILHLKESVLNDTIYLVNKNSDFVPKYIINCGRYGMTPEIKGDTDNFFENRKKYIGGMRFFETSNYLLLRYFYNGEQIPCYFDKKANKLLYFNSGKGIPDDYAGGIDFWPSKQKNNLLFGFYNAPDLLDHYFQQKKITPKGTSNAIHRVQSLINQLDAEDNPVLIIARIKQ